MRCKKHLPDISSTVGVCASCLRERLLKIVVESQAQPSHLSVSETKPPSLQPIFPRSASPFVTHRKSDDCRQEVLFQSTPPGDRGLSAACDGAATQSSKRRIRKFWILSDLYRPRPRSSKTDNSSGKSCEPSSSSVSPRSLTWLSIILPVRRQNNRVSDQRRCRELDRGATPVDNFEGRDQSELGTSLESSPYRNKTTAAVTARRSRLCHAGKSLASMALCLSPLVRASPNRNWSNHNHKGFSHELGVGGVQHISTAASFCTNRSKKLVDFGRVAQNHKR
ncbi:unnamed protein product [Lathyrus oleraceus]